jgi:uncharacterized membrane protein YkoI
MGWKVLAVLLISMAAWSMHAETEAKLEKQAKISKTQAEHIALEKVPHGSIKSAEIEHEKGRIVWSFDIATPGRRDITEILVDARSGQIVSKTTETPSQQADEAGADRQGH